MAASIAILYAVCGAARAQVANPYELHAARIVGADVIEFAFSRTTAAGRRAIAFDAVEFLDAGSQVVASLDIGTPLARYYLGPSAETSDNDNGWIIDEIDPGSGNSFVWARGTRARIVYPIPQQAATLRVRAARPAVDVTDTVSVNGETIGTILHDADAPGGNWFAYQVSLTAVRRKLTLAAPASGATVRLRSVQFLNAQNQATWGASGLDLAPGGELLVSTSWSPCDLVVEAEASGAQPGDLLRVYLNRVGDEMLVLQRPLRNGLAAYTSAEPDPLQRHGDFRAPAPETARWVEDFRHKINFLRSPNTSAEVANGVLTMTDAAAQNGEVHILLKPRAALRIGPGGARYLTMRLRAPIGVQYYLRMTDLAFQLYSRPVTALEARPGTGDWETLVFDLDRYFLYSGMSNIPLGGLYLVAVNNAGPTPYPANRLDVDYLHFGAAPTPNPPDVTDAEVAPVNGRFAPLIDGLDNDLDGYVDRADPDYAAAQPRQVIAYYHGFFGCPTLDSGWWANWGGAQQEMLPSGEVRPTGVVFNPDNFIGSGAQTRRDLASWYWPLRYSAPHRWHYGYAPPIPESQLDWNTRAGLNYEYFSFGPSVAWGYDVYNADHLKNQMWLASDFGIDAFGFELGGQNPALTFSSRMHRMLDVAAQVSAAWRPFGVAAFYTNYYPNDSSPGRDWTEMAADLHYILREYAGHSAYFRPWRNALGAPGPFERLWNSPLVLATVASGNHTWETWRQVFSALDCPLRCPFRAEIALPFRPAGEWTYFRIRCENPVKSGNRWLGVNVDCLGVARADLSVVRNAAGATRYIEVGTAGDSADLLCGGQCPSPLNWGPPRDADAFPNGKYRTIDSPSASGNTGHFRLWLDAADGPNAPRFLLVRWLACDPTGGRVYLEYWDAGAGQYVTLCSLGQSGGPAAVSGVGWAYDMFRLRYPGDPANLADLCGQEIDRNIELLSDAPGYVRRIGVARDPQSSDPALASLFTGAAAYTPAFCYDTGVEVNLPIRTCVTAWPGFRSKLLIGYNQDTLPRRDGLEYQEWWEKCLLTDPEYAFICSFNEWNEGTQIEPTVENGMLYLELTLTYSLIYKRKLSVQNLPTRSGLIVKRFDPRSSLKDPARAYTQTIIFAAKMAETLRFANLLDGGGAGRPAMPASFSVTKDGAPYGEPFCRREGADLVIATQTTAAPATYQIELIGYPRRGPSIMVY